MADRPSLNWWMKGSETSSFKPVLNLLLADFKAEFITLTSDGVTHGPNVLFEDSDTGYRLEEDTSMQDNQFHPYTCEGAGELFCEFGHLPILFFASLNKRINEVPELTDKLTLCNEKGEDVQLNDWPDLLGELRRLEINSDQVRTDAEAIGFVDAIIHLDKIVTDEPSMFF